jgi:hypothetical protein
MVRMTKPSDARANLTRRASKNQRQVRVQQPAAAVSRLHDIVEQADRQFDRELAADNTGVDARLRENGRANGA